MSMRMRSFLAVFGVVLALSGAWVAPGFAVDFTWSKGGFKIRKVEAGSIYEQLGLQKGDRITAINGSMPKSPDQVFQDFFEGKGPDTLKIQIVRNKLLTTRTLQRQ